MSSDGTGVWTPHPRVLQLPTQGSHQMHFISALVYIWLSLFNYYKNFMKLTMLEFGVKDGLQLPSPAHSHSYLAPAYLRQELLH